MKCTQNVRQTNLMFGGAFFMAKYSFEQKLKAVLDVKERQMSYRRAATLLGCAKPNVLKWVRMYDQFGPEGLSIKNGTYSGDFKLHAVEYMHKNRLSLLEAAAILGIPNKNQLSKWERIFYEEGPRALYIENRGRKKEMSSKHKKPKELDKQTEEDLIAEVQRLRMENDYLKKLNALVQKRIARESGKKPPSSKN